MAEGFVLVQEPLIRLDEFWSVKAKVLSELPQNLCIIHTKTVDCFNPVNVYDTLAAKE